MVMPLTHGRFLSDAFGYDSKADLASASPLTVGKIRKRLCRKTATHSDALDICPMKSNEELSEMAAFTGFAHRQVRTVSSDEGCQNSASSLWHRRLRR